MKLAHCSTIFFLSGRFAWYLSGPSKDVRVKDGKLVGVHINDQAILRIPPMPEELKKKAFNSTLNSREDDLSA